MKTPMLCRLLGGAPGNSRRSAARPFCCLSGDFWERNRRSIALPFCRRPDNFSEKGRRSAAVLLAAVLFANMFLLTACGGTAAASMHLKRTEGTVHVADGEGQALTPEEDLALYSGCRVGTGAESYAWIDLDKVKLTKLDARSEIEIQKENKALTIEVLSGSLFFNVCEPLAEDETMGICTSSMLVGIRGTCGWVHVPDAGHMELYLLEGRVECTAGESTAPVRAGEKASMTAGGAIEVSAFSVGDIPAFVINEVKQNDQLREEIQNDSGLDITTHPTVKYGDTYEDVLANIDGDILQTEEVDFDLDGSPELTVLYTQESDGSMFVLCNIYRTGPDGLTLSGGYGEIFFTGDGKYRDGSFSLVESDGRIYQKWHTVYVIQGENGYTNIQEKDAYYGFVPAKTGDGTEMFLEKLIYGHNHSSTGIQEYYSLMYADGSGSKISAGEYEAFLANYREIRLIAYTPDNVSVALAPVPAGE